MEINSKPVDCLSISIKSHHPAYAQKTFIDDKTGKPLVYIGSGAMVGTAVLTEPIIVRWKGIYYLNMSLACLDRSMS